ncbi:NUDIX hydrolase [Roseobacter sp. AzwK-3b]|uniref:NUDIX hydrolase n=1 Tax=Roseobacter sp. AzwK-3b TaxID=351016 RepID=UPI00015696E1|nr:NUDIX hydrolase [Roseobacter sp. AzwK-3b]EDM72376.1 NUDIX hydrolase [Roseobacter sp. AzwK-3b]
MIEGLKKAWSGALQPFFRLPEEEQSAALCCRTGADGTEVLLITSRDTGRWILPKGWLEKDMSPAQSAQKEAWEEAGVKSGVLHETGLGKFCYEKSAEDGCDLLVEVEVFRLDVTELADDFPEAQERERAWFRPSDAAEAVQEPELKKILLRL